MLQGHTWKANCSRNAPGTVCIFKYGPRAYDLENSFIFMNGPGP